MERNIQEKLSYIIRINGEWVPAMPDDEEFSVQGTKGTTETINTSLNELQSRAQPGVSPNAIPSWATLGEEHAIHVAR